MTPQIYVDLTTAFEEKGRHPHGTTRVERSVVAALVQLAKPNLRFFTYSRATGRFTVVPRQEAGAIATAPTMPEASRDVEPAWRRHPLTMHARLLKRRLMSGLRIMQTHGLAAVPLDDPFQPGSTLFFPGELQRQDFARLMALKSAKHLAFAFLHYDLLGVLPDDDPRLDNVSASDIPSTDFMVREASLIFAISQYSAEQLRRHLKRRGVPGPPIKTVRLSGQLPFENGRGSPVLGLETGNFVLTVGDVVKRKNHALLATVWRSLATAELQISPLVIVGRIDEESYEFVRGVERDPGLRGRIRFIVNADDSALAWLYNNCRFTVFPSLLEGFGLPVAESLARGKVCIASSAAAIPEAGQGLALELDPFDVDAWSRMIRWLLRDDEALAAQQAQIASKFRAVSWCHTAEDILGPIESLQAG